MFKYIINKVLIKIMPDKLSYSQEGEDKILERYFQEKDKGFYIDVGAHHPIRFSNTYKFYLKGWRGINIDAMPGSMKLFDKIRPYDINIEAAISDKEEILTYYAFNESALNGFSSEIANLRDGNDGYKIVFKKPIRAQKLSSILEKKLPEQEKIDFLSIDVEGLDLEVLKSNDWERYRPKILLVEVLDFDPSNMEANKTISYLDKVGYRFLAKTNNTVFFIDNR